MSEDAGSRQRLRIGITGAVQGVGFRPFVYRLAKELGIAGLVRNRTDGVEIEIEGDVVSTEAFPEQLKENCPPHCLIREMEVSFLPLAGESEFAILDSEGEGGGHGRAGEVLPDLATCGDCLHEIFDPEDRRYLYPFTNCTQCGPRFSIVQSLPYDRANTTMSGFRMCPDCQAEYDDPADRRFHAQPNACPRCGPRVAFGEETGNDAMESATRAIEAGRIVAVKGVGGFHLFADARSDEVVQRLRERKRRPDKPLAVMFPNLDSVAEHCLLQTIEKEILESVAAPIVLLQRRDSKSLADSLAPGNPRLGVLLPYSPLHHLLMRRLGFPVVATSGNLSDEPICISNEEAQERLSGIADDFLFHDRPIERAVDDSVACVMAGRELSLRRSRGYAPAPIVVPGKLRPVLALGGDLKNAIAVTDGDRIFLSQYHGDLESPLAQDAFRTRTQDLPDLSRARPERVVCDSHPGYHSSASCEDAISVQHHHAHIAACLAENGIDETVLGVAWDGTGYGPDGTIWGGEFLIVNGAEFERFSHLRSFSLPGGERCVREPRRTALGLLHEAGIPVEETTLAAAFTEEELRIVRTSLARKIHSPRTSSAGRLFDGLAALLGIRHRTTFEGQAAMELEFLLPENAGSLGSYVLDSSPGNWFPIIKGCLHDLAEGESAARISARIHHSLVELILQVACEAGQSRVALSGGCFQNRYLTETVIRRLREEGFTPIWHRLVPPNDGGLALGQAYVAGRTVPSTQPGVASEAEGNSPISSM
ncbi:MAG: carbamoyltransferase HypF [Verrucomicrobiales bacterium]|nr:carbamoyltransferase HypF [Verrucomicrobiales bacterium]